MHGVINRQHQILCEKKICNQINDTTNQITQTQVAREYNYQYGMVDCRSIFKKSAVRHSHKVLMK